MEIHNHKLTWSIKIVTIFFLIRQWRSVPKFDEENQNETT